MNGVYGTVKPAIINPEKDAEIFYSFKPSRNYLGTERNNFTRLNSKDILKKSLYTEGDFKNTLSGMYDLNLPARIFSEKGIYTLYIKPKEIRTKIIDVSILLAYPDVRGIILSRESLNGIDDVTGYRIEFIGTDGNEMDETRIVTSCFPCKAVKQAVSDKYAENTRYVYSDTTSDLLFCTVTPSISMSFNPNALPYIGESGRIITVTNTKFDPVMLEIEMVDHDIETVSTMLEGTQVRDLDKGKIITFNNNNEIYSVQEYFTLKNKLGEPLYDVKAKKDIFDVKSTEYTDIIKN